MMKAIIPYLEMFVPFGLIVLLPIAFWVKVILIIIWGFVIIWWLDGRKENESLIQFLKNKTK